MATKKDMALLGVIIAAMANAEAPYHMATEKEVAGLAKENFVETNAEIRDGDKIAVRATEAGVAAHTAANAAPTSPNATEGNNSMSNTFEIEDNIPIPAGRGGRNANVYPFDALNVGQSFHVPATDERPNPAKSIASTVSSATKRYADQTPARKFSVKSVGEGDPKGKGARVWRTA